MAESGRFGEVLFRPGCLVKFAPARKSGHRNQDRNPRGPHLATGGEDGDLKQLRAALQERREAGAPPERGARAVRGDEHLAPAPLRASQAQSLGFGSTSNVGVQGCMCWRCHALGNPQQGCTDWHAGRHTPVQAASTAVSPTHRPARMPANVPVARATGACRNGRQPRDAV